MTIQKEAEVGVLEVLDPVAAVAAKTIQPAPRLRDLNGRKIGLFWNTKPRGDIGLEEAARLLEGKFQNLSFEKFRYGRGGSLCPQPLVCYLYRLLVGGQELQGGHRSLQ